MEEICKFSYFDAMEVFSYSNENEHNTTTCNNKDEFHKHIIEQKKPDTRIHIVFSHLHKVQEQTKLLLL